MPYATQRRLVGTAAMSAATHLPGHNFLNGLTGATPSRTEAVLGAIKHAILAGELRPGQSLVETELAQLLGVSKTPVREALKTLAGAGLVTMSAYRGATVRTIDSAAAAAIYDLRLLVEPEALRRAVQSAPAHDGTWALAAAALAAAAAATGEAQRSLANRDFHRALYLGCGNSLLVKVLDDLRDQTALISAQAWAHAPSWPREAAQHQAILAAAQAGQATRAASLLRSHIAAFAGQHFPPASRPAALPSPPATEWSTDEP